MAFTFPNILSHEKMPILLVGHTRTHGWAHGPGIHGPGSDSGHSKQSVHSMTGITASRASTACADEHTYLCKNIRASTARTASKQARKQEKQANKRTSKQASSRTHLDLIGVDTFSTFVYATMCVAYSCLDILHMLQTESTRGNIMPPPPIRYPLKSQNM